MLPATDPVKFGYTKYTLEDKLFTVELVKDEDNGKYWSGSKIASNGKLQFGVVVYIFDTNKDAEVGTLTVNPVDLSKTGADAVCTGQETAMPDLMVLKKIPGAKNG